MKDYRFVQIILTLCLVLVFAGCDGGKDASTGDTRATKASADGRCPHEIKQDKCPFCNPALIESEGFCGEHGVAEAICAQCRPYLKAAFRANNDWCTEHSVPESQCVICNPELKERIRPGEHGAHSHSAASAGAAAPVAAGNCEHGIAQAKCPFCTPTLVQSDGFCKEHNVAEALCVRCRPYLKTAFIAKGDWCDEHETPESQCVLCNPELNKPSGGNG